MIGASQGQHLPIIMPAQPAIYLYTQAFYWMFFLLVIWHAAEILTCNVMQNSLIYGQIRVILSKYYPNKNFKSNCEKFGINFIFKSSDFTTVDEQNL